ncbi:RHS repeat-associated core domain-containing protein, partial [Desulfocucumis palustris]|uniref:RHS repeat-associated core domain-containing protein n=1 Tax=Desulfocucumis palustris TaxID=1898651 RepID=UPI001A9A6704
DETRFTFTGAPYFSGPGLYQMGARYYNPEIGRFITNGTYRGNIYEPWTQNLYTYCNNNPINYVDPTGHAIAYPQDIARAGITAIGAAGAYAISQTTNFAKGAKNTWDRIWADDSAGDNDVKNESVEEAGEASEYKDITAPGSRYINESTNVSKNEFGENLTRSGWKKSVGKDGKTTIYEKDGAKYVLRDSSKI